MNMSKSRESDHFMHLSLTNKKSMEDHTRHNLYFVHVISNCLFGYRRWGDGPTPYLPQRGPANGYRNEDF